MSRQIARKEAKSLSHARHSTTKVSIAQLLNRTREEEYSAPDETRLEGKCNDLYEVHVHVH